VAAVTAAAAVVAAAVAVAIAIANKQDGQAMCGMALASS